MANNGTLVLTSVTAVPMRMASPGPVLALAAHGRPEAYDVRFVARTSTGEDVAVTFTEPFACAAVLRRADIERLGAGPVDTASMDGFVVCFLPSGIGTSPEERLRIDQWIEDAPLGTRPVVDLVIRGDRIRWRASMCVIHGAPDRFWDLLQAVTSFSFYEGRLRKLEADLDTVWPTAERDAILTRRLDARSLRRWAHVDGMTEDLVRRRLEFARLEPHLEKPSLALSLSAQRAIAELTVQADVEDRLIYVDDRLEVFEDLYERANERLCDYSYFRREHLVEIAIVVVLLLQVTVDVLAKFR
ncbi:MAG: hypothetical protein M3O46_19165 [Myxococcota bacterium]|nr:hypothetical protein [Myxococcota bacterium]